MEPNDIYIYIGVLCLAVTLASCAASADKELDDMRRFMDADRFVASSGSIVSPPEPVPPFLRAFAMENYDTDVRVRRELARYFLRYDTELLKHGFLDTDHGSASLLEILWIKEGDRNYIIRESSSISAMRNHILKHGDWFGATPIDLRHIESNKMLLDRYIREATSRPSGN